VVPHITQYTVYIIDNCTGNFINKVNVTETSFRRNISDDHSHSMYHVTAWNSGGESDMSALLPGYLPYSKLTLMSVPILARLLRIFVMSWPSILFPYYTVPNSIAAEDIDIHREHGALDIHLHVSCD